MKTLKLLLLSILFIGLNSCSSSDDSEGGSGVASITLTPSTATQMVGEVITFTVITDTGEDVTSQAVLKAGDTPFTGATFVSAATGTFTINASYGGVSTSTVVKFIDVPPTSIVLTANTLSQSTGEDILFTVKTNTGIDVTATSTITAGSTTITGGIFNSATPGNFTVGATYQALVSETITVTFTTPINFTRRVLIEDFTGTWCGWCPRVSRGVELVKEATDKAVVVAIHSGSTNPASNGYDPYNFNVPTLENLIGLQSYPTAMLNRMTSWSYPEPNNVDQVVDLTDGAGTKNPKLGIALKSTVSGGNISLEVKTKFGKAFTGAKLVVYVLENGLIFNQVNYTTYFGGTGGNTIIPDFVHEHVLRATLTNVLGDAFTPTESAYNNVVTKTFNVAVPANVTDASKLEFVAFVVGPDNKAINVRNSVSGDDQSFEVVE